MLVMVLQGRKSSPQKSRPLESGHRRHGIWIAIEYSYKLGRKKEFKFLCELGWFSQIQSHNIVTCIYIYMYPRAPVDCVASVFNISKERSNPRDPWNSSYLHGTLFK